MMTTQNPIILRQVDLSCFKYDKARKMLIASTAQVGLPMGRFPEFLEVRSHHTGRVVKWIFDNHAAMQAEFWDGEEAHYFTHEDLKTVETLVIHNAC
jgi:hypothetical protein